MIVLPQGFLLLLYRSLRAVIGQLFAIIVLAMHRAREEAVERANLIWRQSQYEGAIPLILSPHPILYFGQPAYDLSIPTSYASLYLNLTLLAHQHNARPQ